MFTALGQTAQTHSHGIKRCNLPIDVRDFGFSTSAKSGAVLPRLNPQRQEFPNFLKREAEFLCTFDEPPPPRGIGRKLTISSFRPRRLGQQPSTFVVANRFEFTPPSCARRLMVSFSMSPSRFPDCSVDPVLNYGVKLYRR